MMSYLVSMAVRLMEMRRLLKSSGTIRLHCDQTAGHYIKALLDCIFGERTLSPKSRGSSALDGKVRGEATTPTRWPSGSFG